MNRLKKEIFKILSCDHDKFSALIKLNSSYHHILLQDTFSDIPLFNDINFSFSRPSKNDILIRKAKYDFANTYYYLRCQVYHMRRFRYLLSLNMVPSHTIDQYRAEAEASFPLIDFSKKDNYDTFTLLIRHYIYLCKIKLTSLSDFRKTPIPIGELNANSRTI